MTAPLDLLRTDVSPDWIDYNDHMNVAYYVMVFDQAMDEFLNLYGLGKDYTLGGHGSVFALQNHIHYMREVSVGTRLGVNLQFLDLDASGFMSFFACEIFSFFACEIFRTIRSSRQASSCASTSMFRRGDQQFSRRRNTNNLMCSLKTIQNSPNQK